METFLFIFTFIFGIITLLTYTKIFNKELTGFFDTLYIYKLPIFWKYLDVLIFLLSLAYQINYWLL